MAAITSTPKAGSMTTATARKKGPFNPSAIIINGTLLMVVLAWILPTVGLLISSFRDRTDIQTSGWWTIFPHQERVLTEEFPKPADLNPDGVMTIRGATGTFEQFRAGVLASDGSFIKWNGNKRAATIQVQKPEWKWGANWTLDNYSEVLGGQKTEIRHPDGTVETVQSDNFINAAINSLVVTIPATVIPILIAAFAAYGFAWMHFPGRKPLFIMIVALLVVPLQIALVPVLTDYAKLGLNGTFVGIWLAHAGFGLSLATYLLYGYISQLPRDLLESAFIDGASHFTIFTRLILPLSTPALASFAIFQFLWVWNDYLVALIFLSNKADLRVLTIRIADLVGSRGNDWHLLTAGAFISMILPLVVFFSLQRYFVRGLLAGSVKG